MYATTGQARLLEPAERQAQWQRAVDSLAGVAEYASLSGVRLAIEPLNRFETDLVNTVEQGLRLCADIGVDNVGLMLDTFHMNMKKKACQPPSGRRETACSIFRRPRMTVALRAAATFHGSRWSMPCMASATPAASSSSPSCRPSRRSHEPSRCGGPWPLPWTISRQMELPSFARFLPHNTWGQPTSANRPELRGCLLCPPTGLLRSVVHGFVRHDLYDGCVNAATEQMLSSWPHRC